MSWHLLTCQPNPDRYFLDRICTHILAFEDDGNVVWFEVRPVCFATLSLSLWGASGSHFPHCMHDSDVSPSTTKPTQHTQGDFSEYQKDLMARNGGMEPRRPTFRPLPAF